MGPNRIEDCFVESPEFNERYIIGTWNPKIEGAFCPIDGTQLVGVIEYGFSGYVCKACEHQYPPGMTDPDQLKQQARYYASDIEKCISEGRVMPNNLPKLQKIVDAAKKNCVL